jgi:1-acyl-sn-glycerol-3-phosphate acyltransferase
VVLPSPAETAWTMSKKDKDKRRKVVIGTDSSSSWLGDLRQLRRRSPAPPPLEGLDGSAAPDAPHESAEEDPSAAPIPALRPVIIEQTEDLGDETQTDIAPIGPTEVAGALLSESMGALTQAVPSPPAQSDPRSSAPPSPVPPPASITALQQQIRDLEARLDEMIAAPHHEHAAWKAGSTIPAAPQREPVHDRQSPSVAVVSSEDGLIDSQPPGPRATARDLLPPDFYLRHWGRAGLRKRAEEVDEFGHDPKYEARFLPFFDFLYRTYFRVDAEGIEHIPAAGRCLLVSNHSGGPLPYDGIMLRTTVRRELVGAAEPRELRWLAEDFIYHLPFVGTAMNRLGAVRACQENAERLLARGDLVAVFPEGAKGIGKLFRERYRLQRFGRGGFIRLCLRTQTPIVPAAIVGAEEANPMLYRLEYMAKVLGVPYLPITPTFPALGPLGLLPAPTKWKVVFGEPIHFDAYGPEAADDDLLVGRLAERVRATIQAMLDRALAGRSSIWFG